MNHQPLNRNKTPFLKRASGTNGAPNREIAPCATKLPRAHEGSRVREPSSVDEQLAPVPAPVPAPAPAPAPAFANNPACATISSSTPISSSAPTQACTDNSTSSGDMWQSALCCYHVPARLWNQNTQAQFLCATDEHNNHVHLESALLPSFDVYEFHELSSTNILAKQAIDADAPEGTAVLAHQQRAGYGRQGRTWNSQPGGMYLSFVLRPRVRQAEYPSLALVVGLALRNFLAARLQGTPCEHLARFLSVKWPNDVLAPCSVPDGADAADAPRAAAPVALDAPNAASTAALAAVADASTAAKVRVSAAADVPTVPHVHENGASSTHATQEHPMGKLAGISCEVHQNALCVGVGLNILVPETCQSTSAPSMVSQPLFAPAYWENIAASPLPGSHEYIARFACDFLAYFSAPYALWQEKGFAPFVDAYTIFSYLTGKMVHIVNQNGTEHARGRVAGVHPSGCLLVNTSSNARLISSGEVHITHISDYHSKNGK